MPAESGSGEALLATSIAKFVLAILAVFLLAYYRIHWDRAKKHLQVRFFYANWKTAKSAFALGLAATGLAVGFGLELVGNALGVASPTLGIAAGVFETIGLLAVVYLAYRIALEDVPHYQRAAESGNAPANIRSQKQFTNTMKNFSAVVNSIEFTTTIKKHPPKKGKNRRKH